MLLVELTAVFLEVEVTFEDFLGLIDGVCFSCALDMVFTGVNLGWDLTVVYVITFYVCLSCFVETWRLDYEKLMSLATILRSCLGGYKVNLVRAEMLLALARVGFDSLIEEAVCQTAFFFFLLTTVVLREVILLLLMDSGFVLFIKFSIE